jgi:hypothetical protein
MLREAAGKTGEIVYKLRGDGAVKKKWEDAKKRGVK